MSLIVLEGRDHLCVAFCEVCGGCGGCGAACFQKTCCTLRK